MKNPEPTGGAGNKQLTNQDEAEILKRSAVLPSRAEGKQEQEFHRVPNWLPRTR
ncbi:hypothetical protein [Streptomyces halobius]|uniref:Uncharacterized protein n=1 Tax=Streptomyces halobius TaxID=2879846 RepID=A0ABY4M5X5_9ACTN|nr:hypothetical protein [Streptomyces halobius]UQA91631.1 hypothetical protein K9S39_06950 [Streptomyces halobius]